MSVPAFIKYFNDDTVLGLWYTVLSVLSWMLTFDFGIGNGLRNNLVSAIAGDNRDDIKRLISSAYAMLGAAVIVIAPLGYFIAPFMDWNSVFKVAADAIEPSVMLRAIRFLFIGLIINLFLRLINSVLYALQKSAVNDLIALLSSVLQLTFVLLMPISADAGENLMRLAYAYIVFMNLPLAMATAVVFGCNKKLRGTLNPFVKKNIRPAYIKKVTVLGGIFFICQIFYMIIFNTNELWITSYLTSADVVEYQFYNKIYGILGMICAIATAPVWSMITKAISENNFVWVKKLYKILNLLAIPIVAAEFLITPALQFIFDVWLGKGTAQVNLTYALIFSAFGGVFIYQNILSAVVGGIGDMRIQAISYGAGILVKIILIHLTIKYYNTWIVIIAANFIILLVYSVLQKLALDRYIKSKLCNVSRET
jgi:O-antigen/teichoic acid export membrane protein